MMAPCAAVALLSSVLTACLLPYVLEPRGAAAMQTFELEGHRTLIADGVDSSFNNFSLGATGNQHQARGRTPAITLMGITKDLYIVNCADSTCLKGVMHHRTSAHPPTPYGLGHTMAQTLPIRQADNAVRVWTCVEGFTHFTAQCPTDGSACEDPSWEWFPVAEAFGGFGMAYDWSTDETNIFIPQDTVDSRVEVWLYYLREENGKRKSELAFPERLITMGNHLTPPVINTYQPASGYPYMVYYARYNHTHDMLRYSRCIGMKEDRVYPEKWYNCAKMSQPVDLHIQGAVETLTHPVTRPVVVGSPYGELPLFFTMDRPWGTGAPGLVMVQCGDLDCTQKTDRELTGIVTEDGQPLWVYDAQTRSDGHIMLSGIVSMGGDSSEEWRPAFAVCYALHDNPCYEHSDVYYAPNLPHNGVQSIAMGTVIVTDGVDSVRGPVIASILKYPGVPSVYHAVIVAFSGSKNTTPLSSSKILVAVGAAAAVVLGGIGIFVVRRRKLASGGAKKYSLLQGV